MGWPRLITQPYMAHVLTLAKHSCPLWGGGSGGRAPLGHYWVSGSRAQKHLTSAVLGQVPAGASLG